MIRNFIKNTLILFIACFSLGGCGGDQSSGYKILGEAKAIYDAEYASSYFPDRLFPLEARDDKDLRRYFIFWNTSEAVSVKLKELTERRRGAPKKYVNIVLEWSGLQSEMAKVWEKLYKKEIDFNEETRKELARLDSRSSTISHYLEEARIPPPMSDQ